MIDLNICKINSDLKIHNHESEWQFVLIQKSTTTRTNKQNLKHKKSLLIYQSILLKAIYMYVHIYENKLGYGANP
jgi:hypothetical protein